MEHKNLNLFVTGGISVHGYPSYSPDGNPKGPSQHSKAIPFTIKTWAKIKDNQAVFGPNWILHPFITDEKMDVGAPTLMRPCKTRDKKEIREVQVASWKQL